MKKILPTNDLLFRKIFTSEGSETILRRFLKDVLYRDFSNLTPLETYRFEDYYQQLDRNLSQPATRVGVLGTSWSGRPSKIELQVQPQSLVKAPSLLDYLDDFWCPVGMRNAATRRKETSEAIYLVNIANYELFEPDSLAVRYLGLVDLDTHELIEGEEGDELFTLCFFSLKNRNLLDRRPIEQWHAFFRTGKIAKNAPFYLKEAQQLADFSNLSEEEQELALEIEEGLFEEWAGIPLEERIAQETGYYNGSEQRAQEIALKLLSGGVLMERVAEYTGLTPETVRDLALKKVTVPKD